MSHLTFRGTLTGHNGWVTALATTPENPDMIISASRDRTIMVWNLTHNETEYGYPRRALRGHSHFISDISISSDGNFVLSGSWDATLRLWEINSGRCVRQFINHRKDVMTVSFSANNRQILSGSRDKSIKLWNTLGECKNTITNQNSQNGHNDWVSCVRFSPIIDHSVFVTCGWDHIVKVWNLEQFSLTKDLIGHTGYVNTITISPDGSLCASGGKDGTAFLWELKEGKKLYSLPAGEVIHSLIFSPNRYWLCAATERDILIWDLETKELIETLQVEFPHLVGKKSQTPYCTSLAWSANGQTLFAGYTDGNIRVWHVNSSI